MIGLPGYRWNNLVMIILNTTRLIQPSSFAKNVTYPFLIGD